jgi:hypothetical protein
MKRMFDFVCENRHRTEKLVDYETTSFMCECGASASRTLSAPAFRLEGWSGAFPSAHGRFEKNHLDKLKAERKSNS